MHNRGLSTVCFINIINDNKRKLLFQSNISVTALKTISSYLKNERLKQTAKSSVTSIIMYLC